MNIDRSLLFALTAFQRGLISTDQLAQACSEWKSDNAKSLGDLLVARGWLSTTDRTDIERGLSHFDPTPVNHAGANAVAAADAHVERMLAALDSSEIQQSGVPTYIEPTETHRTVGPASAERYARLRMHATGGLGQVWLARDSSLDREVALKELRPDLANNAALGGRFLDEAKITGQLEHPGIVPVYELAQSPTGSSCYYTMRFIKGRTLTEAARDYHRRRRDGVAEPLAFAALLNAFVSVCNAVGYAHSHGVIHRDLKGQNVILGDYGEAILLDWGLAKRTGSTEHATIESHAPAGPQAVLTQVGQIIGTPAYMPPEQAEGRLDRVDQRSDIYSLGAMLYEILTGRSPFSGTDSAEVLRQVREEEPARPRQLVPTVPFPLEAVCRKAMAKKQDDRYAAAADLAKEVQRWLADEPVDAYPEPWTVRLRRWGRRHRTYVSSAAVLLVTTVVALTVGLILLGKKQEEVVQQRNAARTAEANTKKSAVKLARVKNFLLKDLLEQAAPENNPLHKEITVREAVDRSARQLTADAAGTLRDQPDLQAALHEAVGNTYLSLGRLPEANTHLTQARDLAEHALDEHDPDRLIMERSYAGLLIAQGKFAEAETLFRRILAATGDVHGSDSLEAMHVLADLGGALQLQEKFAEADAVQRQALHGLRSWLGPDDAATLNAMNSLALTHYRQQRWADAEALYRQALDAEKRVLPLEHPLYLGTVNNLAVLLQSQQKPELAEQLYLDTLKSQRAALGPEHPQVTVTLTNLGTVLNAQKKHADAEAAFRELIRIDRKILPPDHPNLANDLGLLGVQLVYTNKAKDAEPFLRECMDIRRKILPKGSREIANTEGLLGVSLTALGRFDDAEKLLLSGYEQFAADATLPRGFVQEAARRLEELYKAWDKPSKAAEWHKRRM